MNGLLDFIKTPEGQGLLGMVAGYAANAQKGAPINSVGRGLGAGLLAYNGAAALQDKSSQEAQERELRQMQIAQMRGQVEDQNLASETAKRFLTPAVPGSMGDANLPPELQTGAVPMAGKPASFDMRGYAQARMAQNPMAGMSLMAQLEKENKPIELAAGASLIDPKTMKPVFTAPKEQSLPAAIQEYQFAQGQGYKGSFEQWDTARKRAGAATTTVTMDNLGLKPKDRFEMEDKLRGDYSKATADDQAITATAADIKNILAQGGALKDQAAIYKFAKALDPQGAVREADYAAIVRTAGGLEYVTNLVQKALTGEQLSPKQRVEMENVTAAMARVAQQRIARQQQVFSRRAGMYNLAPSNVFDAGTGGPKFLGFEGQ